MSNAPLFPTIPLTNVVINNLHLFLWVSDVLLDLLITELKRQDSINKVKRFSSFDITKYKHMQGFEQFIKGLGIPGFEFYVGRTSKMLKSRLLTGPEKLKVFHNKKVWVLLPNFPCNEASKIQHLWDELLQLKMLFSSAGDDLSPAVIDTFECWARE